VNKDPATATFHEADASHIPALLRMMRGLAQQPPELPFDEEEVGAALVEFLAHPDYGRAWLIWVGRQIVGYVILTLGYSFEYRGRDAFIDELYIGPEFRRQRLGTQAMEFLEERARAMGVNALHLEVDRENEPALKLYQKKQYADHHRYLMTKWLRQQPR
jgi:ribosomal protein S18 acetylase RimI-like enzyme